MFMNVLIVSIAGGLLCLDRVFIQTLISRPIVAAPVTGAILGDPYTGLIAGAFIELFWIDRLPIGAYVPPNDTVAAILIAACAIESGRILGQLPQGLIALAVLIFVPFAYLAQQLDRWIIRGNEKPADDALMNVMSGAPPRHCAQTPFRGPEDLAPVDRPDPDRNPDRRRRHDMGLSPPDAPDHPGAGSGLWASSADRNRGRAEHHPSARRPSHFLRGIPVGDGYSPLHPEFLES